MPHWPTQQTSSHILKSLFDMDFTLYIYQDTGFWKFMPRGSTLSFWSLFVLFFTFENVCLGGQHCLWCLFFLMTFENVCLRRSPLSRLPQSMQAFSSQKSSISWLCIGNILGHSLLRMHGRRPFRPCAGCTIWKKDRRSRRRERGKGGGRERERRTRGGGSQKSSRGVQGGRHDTRLNNCCCRYKFSTTKNSTVLLSTSQNML